MDRFIVQDRAGRRSVASERQMTIGRGEQNDLVLDAVYASRRHAWAWRQGDRMIVEDLGSTHGTWVNGARLTAPRFLSHHDVVQIGEARLLYVSDRVPAVGVPLPGAPQFDYPLYCQQCGTLNDQAAAYCFRCGYTLQIRQWADDWQGGSRAPGVAPAPPVIPGSEDERITERAIAPRRPLTPVEPVVVRPFPRTPGAVPGTRRRQTRVWILLLAIVALLLLVVLGMLAIYVLVLLEGG